MVLCLTILDRSLIMLQSSGEREEYTVRSTYKVCTAPWWKMGELSRSLHGSISGQEIIPDSTSWDVGFPRRLVTGGKEENNNNHKSENKNSVG